MENMLIKEGIHYLSGVDDISVNYGWEDEYTDGIALCIDDKTFIAYNDPNDGYRSYGWIEESNREVFNTFPPQKVKITYHSWDGIDESGWSESGHYYEITNPDDNSTILIVGTDTSDSYYPVALFQWHPENLPINKKK